MSQLLYSTVPATPPLLVPLCFVTAWSFILLLAWNIGFMIRSAVNQGVKMHKIPCANCQYFVRSYHLKCTVNPDIALSEAAIDCPDYQDSRTSTRSAQGI